MFRALTLIALLLPVAAIALDDPMRPPSLQPRSAPSSAPASSGYRLSSTLISEQRRFAVINGRRVEVGDRVGEARVTAIYPATVDIALNGRHKTLRLIPLTVKRPSKAERP